jgi:type I restriction enzyme, R subunit
VLLKSCGPSPKRLRLGSEGSGRDWPVGASAVADSGSDGAEPGSLLPDQRVGALTQIFQAYKPDVTPEIVERVVHEIDAVVMGIRFAGWQTSKEGDRTVKFEIRKAFKKYGLEPTGELFDRAYAYVAEHY